MDKKFLVVIVWSAQCHRGVEMVECANMDDAKFYLRAEREAVGRMVEIGYITQIITKVEGDLRKGDKG